MFSGISTRPVISRFLARGQAGTQPRRFAPRGGERSLSLAVAICVSVGWQSARIVTEPTLALGRGQAQAPNPLPTRQASARFRIRPMTDSPVSARSTPLRSNFGGRQCGSHLHLHFTSFRRSQTARQSENVGREGVRRPRDFVRPRHRITARGSPVAEEKALARDATHGQGPRINREIGPFRTASISQATLQRTETTELTDGGPTARWLVWPHGGRLTVVLPARSQNSFGNCPADRRNKKALRRCWQGGTGLCGRP